MGTLLRLARRCRRGLVLLAQAMRAGQVARPCVPHTLYAFLTLLTLRCPAPPAVLTALGAFGLVLSTFETRLFL